MKRDDQSRNVHEADIARQALLPGETPMCALSTGHNLLRGSFRTWWREWRGAFQADGLAADHFQPRSADAATWPVTPENWSRGTWCAGWIGRRRGIRVRRRKRPQD